MRIKDGFELLTICGVTVVVAHGRANMDFSKLISLNESAAYLWSSVEGRDFDEQELARLLQQEYEVSEELAQQDASKILREWQSAGLVE
ncbi:MAG: PqqD family protein [Bacteroidaceae bacterium]|nr:PqqD family protein [Bacteroidaceae bacterium]